MSVNVNKHNIDFGVQKIPTLHKSTPETASVCRAAFSSHEINIIGNLYLDALENYSQLKDWPPHLSEVRVPPQWSLLVLSLLPYVDRWGSKALRFVLYERSDVPYKSKLYWYTGRKNQRVLWNHRWRNTRTSIYKSRALTRLLSQTFHNFKPYLIYAG